MPSRTLAGLVVIVLLAAGGFLACSEDEPVAPAAGHHAMGDVTTLALFPFRAPLDPFSIVQPPDLFMRANTTRDFVIQNLTFQPGAGMWHYHPGPSFVGVIEGEIKVERFTKDGCVETPVFTVGDAYVEIAREVHRAVVVSAVPAVLLVVRFIPPDSAITTNVSPPDC